MSEQPWQPTDAELERALADLGSRVVYPPADPVAAAVRERLRAQPAPPAQRWVWIPVRQLRRGLTPALLALALLAGTILALSPGARTAVASWLGLQGVVFLYRPAPAHPTAVVGAPLHLGQRLLLPALGPPDEVYLEALAHGTQVALVYRPRTGLPRVGKSQVGLLLTEARGSFGANPVFFKGLEPGTRVELVQVNGTQAYWITGKPHLFGYLDDRGVLRMETVRLAGNVLLWARPGLVLRLESALPEAAALRIAASVR